MKILVIILIVAGLIGGYAYANQQGWLPTNAPKIETPAVSLEGDVGAQLTVLSSRAQELGGHAQEFFSKGIQTDSTSEQSLSQKAVDYGQYLYCKQVVTTYEARANDQPNNEPNN